MILSNLTNILPVCPFLIWRIPQAIPSVIAFDSPIQRCGCVLSLCCCRHTGDLYFVMCTVWTVCDKNDSIIYMVYMLASRNYNNMMVLSISTKGLQSSVCKLQISKWKISFIHCITFSKLMQTFGFSIQRQPPLVCMIIALHNYK